MIPFPVLAVVYVFLCLAALVFLATRLSLGRKDPVYLTRSYPPTLKAAYRPMTEPEKRYAFFWAAPVFALIVLFPAGYVVWEKMVLARDFLGLWLDGFLLYLSFGIVDLLILDWLIFCLWTPRFLVLPGTEGHPAYKDYGFHFLAFLRGTMMTAVLALVFAAAAEGIGMVAGRGFPLQG